ncbi:ImmA/IrrE family metallo-endopeptidase [Corynebacterium pygosceleis]|uniref:ImmA/IrrE family metallo-endopeptidase n=1 Tax=Corynebacterium pygosceleis TaxID=2800406 RepID=UPI001902D8EF|nr:ImmA/IrrE family metallo-endopeptidase [Corynebacterium pygosceleis]MCL0120659.1 ImmA/IrrE family metallo-endopeptidase [Corynebacterium pygosceleis]
MDHKLYRIADNLGVRIGEHEGGERGRWYDGPRIITIRRGLTYIEHRCTLAHEIGHAILDHITNAPAWIQRKQERAADQWATGFLITPEAYAAAEELRGNHRGGIASELYVTRHLVDIWQLRWQRRTDDLRVR